jgi:hypothetical protein
MGLSLANSTLLSTIICLILVFALLSLLVSTLTEVVNKYFNERGEQLYTVISRMFEDGLNVNFGQLLYNHPMIATIRKDLNTQPQYISNEMFSQVLIDVVGNYGRSYAFDPAVNAIVLQPSAGAMGGATGSASAGGSTDGLEDPFALFKAGINKMEYTDLKLMLLSMVEKSAAASGPVAGQPIIQLINQLQQWYGDQMDRTSGWFKDLMRTRILIISFLVAIGLNVNSIYLFKTLYSSPTLRAQLEPVAGTLADNYAKAKTDTSLTALQQAYQAEAMSNLKKGNPDSASKVLHGILTDLDKINNLQHKQDSQKIDNIKQASDELSEVAGLGIPIGWHKGIPPLVKVKFWDAPGVFLWYLVGIVITAFSISAGAPFWFDVLLKLVNVRRAGKKPDS